MDRAVGTMFSMTTTWNEAAHEAANNVIQSWVSPWSVGDQVALHEIDTALRALRDDFNDPQENFASYGFGSYLGAHALGILSRRRGVDMPELADQAAQLLARKQADYGTGNILAFGFQGLVVRMSDKVERLRNLLAKCSDGVTEPLEDALIDLFGYAVIGRMLNDGTFELPLAKPNYDGLLKRAIDQMVEDFNRTVFDPPKYTNGPLVEVNDKFNKLIRDTPSWISSTKPTPDPRAELHDSSTCGTCKRNALRNFRVDL